MNASKEQSKSKPRSRPSRIFMTFAHKNISGTPTNCSSHSIRGSRPCLRSRPTNYLRMPSSRNCHAPDPPALLSPPSSERAGVQHFRGRAETTNGHELTRIFTDFTEGNEGNVDLTESLRDRIMGKANSENLD